MPDKMEMLELQFLAILSQDELIELQFLAKANPMSEYRFLVKIIFFLCLSQQFFSHFWMVPGMN